MKRVVVKIGTKVLSKENGELDEVFLGQLVEQLASVRKSGVEVVVVTSGAVGAGKSILKLQDSGSDTVRKQIYAAVGQVKLMGIYAECFAKHGYHCAQVLVTKEDFRDEGHRENMQRCFEGLFVDNVIPVLNENDVIAITELLFTDNDELAGLVAMQLKADALIILTSTDGVLDDLKRTVREVNAENISEVEGFITPDKSTGGRGGMMSKFKTARALAETGIEVRIVDGRSPGVLVRAVKGEDEGTRFAPIC